MIQLDLTSEELGMLKAVLQSYISDLRMEIADTDSLDFRNQLKAKEQVLTKVMERIEPGTASG